MDNISSNRLAFLLIEINLILWIAVSGQALVRMNESQRFGWDEPVIIDSGLIFIGLVYSAIVQHVGYYWLIRKKAKKDGESKRGESKRGRS